MVGMPKAKSGEGAEVLLEGKMSVPSFQVAQGVGWDPK
jgi:hypothetical protein